MKCNKVEVVLPGPFNIPPLVNFEWIRLNLFPKVVGGKGMEDIKIDGLSDAVTHVIRIDDVSVSVSHARLSISVTNVNADGFDKLDSIVTLLNDALPHMQTLACGINFEFTQETNVSEFPITSPLQCEGIEGAVQGISSQFHCEHYELNLTLRNQPMQGHQSGGVLILDMNFHHGFNPSELLRSMLRVKEVASATNMKMYYDRATRIAANIFPKEGSTGK